MRWRGLAGPVEAARPQGRAEQRPPSQHQSPLAWSQRPRWPRRSPKPSAAHHRVRYLATVGWRGANVAVLHHARHRRRPEGFDCGTWQFWKLPEGTVLMAHTPAAARSDARRYRFPPLVRTGLFGSMPPTQIAVLVVGGGLAFLAVLVRVFPVALGLLLATGVLALSRRRGAPLHEWLPLRISWIARRRQRVWFRPIPLLGVNDRRPVDLPPQLDGLELLEFNAPWATRGNLAGIAAVHDRTAGQVTGVLRVHGDGQFSLTAAHEQDLRVAMWGDALAGFCRERSAVTRVGWQEWSCTNPTASNRTVSTDETFDTDERLAAAQASYRQLIDRAAPAGVTHDVLVTLTVEIAKVRARRQRSTPTLSMALDTLSDELRLFTARLEAAGLHVDPPLTPVQITQACRTRSNPTGNRSNEHQVWSLAGALGISAGDLAPMAVTEDFTAVQVDASVHRSYWVEAWPRLDVPAAWMDLVLLGINGTRNISLVFEPIAPSAAARAIDEAAVALESAEATKTKHGFRIRATDRRKREEIEQREHELVAGHGDLAYAGFFHITAPDLDTLDDLAADTEQTAAHAGLLLRPLDGRHATAWAASLPLSRTLARRRFNP